MFRRAIFRPKAKADLEEIWGFTAERWGDQQAELYIRQLQSAVERLTENPKLGQACDHIRIDYRKAQVGSHILYYRQFGDTIEVVRILHERIDVRRSL